MVNTASANDKTRLRKASLPARLLLEKRLPLPAHYVLFALCLCFGGWFAARGALARISLYSGVPELLINIMCNEVTAFLIGGVMPFLVYFIVTRFTYRMMLAAGAPPVADQAYVFRTFYGLGYLVYGAFSMLYFALPVLELYGEVIIKFVIMAAAVSLYVVFECRHRLPKRGRAIALYAYGLLFSVIYVVYCIAELLMMIGG